MNWVQWNDRLVKDEEIQLSKEDRGYQFGDGIYEVIRVYNGSMFTAKEHINRLYESAEKIKLVIPYTKDVFHKMMYDLIEANEVTTGQVYVQITRGSSPRQHQFPIEAVEPVLTAYTKEVDRPVSQMANGVAAKTIEDVRWLRCDIKSLNLLGNIMAKQEAHESGCFEAILHRGDTITEGSSSNMYGIKDGVLYTHPATNLILNGITRRVILACCEEIGLPVVEQPMSLSTVYANDEFFMSSTTSEIMPIVVIDGMPIGTGLPGEWTKKLQTAFEAKIEQAVHA
ncbi:D-amino-acid transaminase [Paenisporosarcina quisquiliarum]|uniref:D-alanine aminotransferase n=1 Tax=Paenisporosarcina quisquiliarum TaxID=365346 RepID=A0A9X3LED0_9BACL|nr:D-amino-acid transaminase [Paenisporosarcina quisquiliarum]MCZ8536338.1 D-amino-acid transaminase [Paenisporosarcina quisquiliarum]